MESSIPKEVIKEFVEEQVEEMISEVEHAVQEYQKRQLAAKIEELTQDVLSELERRNVDTSRANTRAIVQDNLLETMSEPEQSEGRTVEIPVGGRTNEGKSTTMTLREPDPPTKTIEIPVESDHPIFNDIDEPQTVEKEVIDPDMSDAMLSEGLSDEEVARLNEDEEDDEDEEYQADDIPEGGFPWYQ